MNTVLLIGTGPMAIDFAKVLISQKINFIVVGRGEKSTNNFSETTKFKAISGGIKSWIEKTSEMPEKAIIAVSENELGNVTKQVLNAGIKSILVEKPAGFTIGDISEINVLAKEKKANVFVGYNRRFYTGVKRAIEIINEDGGVTSFNFEFTEWGHVLKDLVKANGVMERWFLHNSTHVIDLAFYLGGKPKELAAYTGGGLPWHPAASIFAGSGISESGALFSYQSNWEAPGRWGVEVLTKKHRLIFRPMEKLQVQKIGSVAIEMVELDYSLDTNFKPGIYKEVEAFIKDDQSDFCMIEEQVENAIFYKQIAGY